MTVRSLGARFPCKNKTNHGKYEIFSGKNFINFIEAHHARNVVSGRSNIYKRRQCHMSYKSLLKLSISMSRNRIINKAEISKDINYFALKVDKRT